MRSGADLIRAHKNVRSVSTKIYKYFTQIRGLSGALVKVIHTLNAKIWLSFKLNHIFTISEKTGPIEPSEQELDELWDEVSSELSAIFQGRSDVPDNVLPFDAASEVDVDQQRLVIINQLKMFLFMCKFKVLILPAK